MKGDFTRNTFDPTNHFARVLMQQGRVQLDADWNEQAAILLHYIRTLAADIIGPHGGHEDHFVIGDNKNGDQFTYDFSISAGHYYVDGILCENEEPLLYTGQSDYPLLENEKLEANNSYLVYLDVWERHLTFIQQPGIREVALGGPDTATRSKVIWQVKTTNYRGQSCPSPDNWKDLVEVWQPVNRGLLKAWARPSDEDDVCITPPEARYRGAENQLYRVEIHRGGPAWDGNTSDDGGRVGNQEKAATFKWSRMNGTVTFPILEMSGDEVTLEHLGRDDRFSLQPGDWVEVMDDIGELHSQPGPLYKVQSVDRELLKVTLEIPTGTNSPYFDESTTTHPLLRRWDYQALDPSSGYPYQGNDNALLVQEEKELLLEDGIQITFEPVPKEEGEVNIQEFHTYRTGDYWLIPARTATGDVEWPGPAEDPTSVSPLGITHHYAPLAIISLDGSGTVTIPNNGDCRCKFPAFCQH